MGMAVKGILSLFWLVLIPMAAGGFWGKKRDAYSLGESFLMGYILLFALSELLILPLLFAGAALHVLIAVYGVLSIAMALWGGFCLWKKRTEIFIRIRGCSPFDRYPDLCCGAVCPYGCRRCILYWSGILGSP